MCGSYFTKLGMLRAGLGMSQFNRQGGIEDHGMHVAVSALIYVVQDNNDGGRHDVHAYS